MTPPTRRIVSDEAAELAPLHGGRHKLDPEVVAFNQRERLIASIAEIVDARGYNETTVARVTDAASISRRTFYELFADKEACFVAAFEAVDDHLREILTEAIASEGSWAEQVARAFTELLGFFAEHPHLARLYWVEATVVGTGTLELRERGAQRLVALLAAGRDERDGGRGLPEGIEEVLAGGVMTLIARRVQNGEAAQLRRFAPALIEFALTPYLGIGRARELASA